MAKRRVLLIEDEDSISEPLAAALQREGFAPAVAGTMAEEFELLRMLMESAGRVVTRTALMDEVWDPNWFGPTKTLDVHVSSLRKKLGDDPSSLRYIHTVRGVGFRFSSPEELLE